MRLVAMQICPLLPKAAQNSCSATFSTSTSGITIAGSLPPSSSVTRFNVEEADCITFLPVAVEPVKLTLSMPGCDVIHGPRLSPPEMMLRTPAGKMSLMISPSFRVVNGVKGDGFNTIVLPANKPGPILNAARIIGKFQGAMAPTTPIGTRRVSL